MPADLRMASPAIERMSRAELLNVQERRLVKQVRRCYERIPFYRERWPSEAAEVTSLDDVRRLIPFTSKQDFLDDHDTVIRTRVANPGSPLYGFHLTSGTSGLGQEIHPVTAFDDEALGSTPVYMGIWAGVRPGDRIVYTFPVGLQTGGLQSRRMTDKLGLTGFFLAPYGTEEKVDYLFRFDVNALVITPAFLTRLTTICEQRGVDPKVELTSFKAIFTAGESYPIEWAERMADFWGAHIAEWYGLMQGGIAHAISCERGVVRDGKRGVLHMMEHRMLCEILDPTTGEQVQAGEEGEMVITPLVREGFPVMRFRTGDRVRFIDECSCGRPFHGIEAGTVARYDDMMKIRGQNVWPDAVDAIVFDDPRIEEYQGTVSIDDDGREQVDLAVEFKPSVEPSGAERDAAVKSLADALKRRTNVRMDVRVADHMSLPRYEFKVRRWTDERRKDRKVVRYTE